MSTEASVIARKVRNYYKVENQLENNQAQKRVAKSKKEIGITRNLLLIALMGMACFSTKITLAIVKLVKLVEA